jgi:hypothetical protein
LSSREAVLTAVGLAVGACVCVQGARSKTGRRSHIKEIRNSTLLDKNNCYEQALLLIAKSNCLLHTHACCQQSCHCPQAVKRLHTSRDFVEIRRKMVLAATAALYTYAGGCISHHCCEDIFAKGQRSLLLLLLLREVIGGGNTTLDQGQSQNYSTARSDHLLLLLWDCCCLRSSARGCRRESAEAELAERVVGCATKLPKNLRKFYSSLAARGRHIFRAQWRDAPHPTGCRPRTFLTV